MNWDEVSWRNVVILQAEKDRSQRRLYHAIESSHYQKKQYHLRLFALQILYNFKKNVSLHTENNLFQTK